MDRPKKYIFTPKPRTVVTNSDLKLDEVKYYQIALYKNDKNLYHVRRITLNGNNSITEVKEAFFKKDNLEEFVKSKKTNTYKIYPVYSLNRVEYPTAADISLARSDILHHSHNYTGFSPYFCN